MQNIHFTNPRIGSVDWELPPKVGNIMDSMAPDVQDALRAELKVHLEAHLTTLVATLQLGEHCPDGFAILREAGKMTSRIMQEFTKELR